MNSPRDCFARLDPVKSPIAARPLDDALAKVRRTAERRPAKPELHRRARSAGAFEII